MSSKSFSLSAEDIEGLYLISDLASRAHRNNLRISNGPEASDYRSKAQNYKKLKVKAEILVEEESALEEERKMLERELDRFSTSLKVSRQRLDGGQNLDYKSLPALRLEVANLEAKVLEYTGAELGMIERLEELARDRSKLETMVKELAQEAIVARDKLEELRRDVALQDGLLQEELTQAKIKAMPEVIALINRVPSSVIDKVAYVVDGSCSGCRLRLSSSLGDRIRRFSSEVHFCEDCGRILLPPRG
ncbi:C4-type zinc ribbon domain-containing protein [Acidithrix sp. C25]|uniref:C4-type zinc ribbon domain-containing protein n=1 Tax=Acidithrix sp. C25 TaxID=1671482 RepID=UPI00191BC4A7|nr:C4-type zinc ribbon domain-containing protein [Acidithrix sp. C25]CAG4914612.1 unnamed protein product [Acidithrix sp. C25]